MEEETIRIEYDDSICDVIEKINKLLQTKELMIVYSDDDGDGYQEYTLKEIKEEK